MTAKSGSKQTGAQRDCPTWAMLHAPWLIQLFTLYVDGLEKHLLETADIDAPTLMGIMVPLLLYADNLFLMSESASGLQKQLDALASFCEQRQLTVNLSKTTFFGRGRIKLERGVIKLEGGGSNCDKHAACASRG